VHVAVMANPGYESFELIKYLINAVPESLETKSTDGYTPLLIAFSLHRYSAAKLLIDAGADQTVRTAAGSNLLDVLLVDPYSQSLIPDKTLLKRMLSLIDPRLIPSLLTERTSVNPGSLTPGAHFIIQAGNSHSYGGLEPHIEELETLLDFAAPTNYAFLELLDGAGDTPLHWAVKNQRQKFMTAFLNRRPDLLFHENSVGRTALEMAEDACLAARVRDPPYISSGTNSSITARPLESFAQDHAQSADSGTAEERIWAQCNEVALRSRGTFKRKLVSLLDANEVANRLAKRHMERRSAQVAFPKEEDDDEEEARGQVDEVRDWYQLAVKGDGVA
jgi:hypothetical protein